MNQSKVSSTTVRPTMSSSTDFFLRRTLFFVFVCFLIQTASCAHILALRSDPASKACKVYKPVHHAMDRICEMCHEMFSQEKPNMRSECRSKCFRNEQFRSCLEIFSSSSQPAIVEEKRRF